MRKKFRRVRGGFIPRTPFYKKYRTAARTTNFRTAIPVLPRSQPLRVPTFRRTSGSRESVADTKTKPRLAPAKVIKKVQTDQEMARGRRRALRYLPALYKRRPRYPMMRRGKRNMYQPITPAGEGATRSFFRSGRRARPRKFGISKMSPEQRWQNIVCNRHTSVAGRQAVWSQDTGNLADLNSLIQLKSTNSLAQAYIKSYTVKYMLTNTSSTNVFVDIYELQPRRSTTALFDAVSAFSNGIAQVDPAETASSIFTTPFQSRQFTQLWVVKKVFRVELAAGRTHIHTSTYNINKLYSSELYTIAQTVSHQPDFTRTLMFVAYGEMANNPTGTLTFAPVSINSGRSEDIRWHFGDQELKTLDYTGLTTNANLALSQINTSGLQIYDEGSGAVEAVVAA